MRDKTSQAKTPYQKNSPEGYPGYIFEPEDIYYVV